MMKEQKDVRLDKDSLDKIEELKKLFKLSTRAMVVRFCIDKTYDLHIGSLKRRTE